MYVHPCSSASAFENDPKALGNWKAVDFVKSISDFKPGQKSWRGKLYMKEFKFNKDGSTQNNAFTWTKGSVHYTEFDLNGKYEIQTIGDEEYLFLQWMNGDVAFRDAIPNYYVFRRK